MTNLSPYINPDDCRTCAICCKGCKHLVHIDGIYSCRIYYEREGTYEYCMMYPEKDSTECPHKKVNVC